MTLAEISICIPFFSGKDYLKRAIQSVLAQTVTTWELLILDDCGPEGDISSFTEAFGDDRIRYLRNTENLGLAANWNRCLDLATAPLTNLLHADDELMPNYCELMLKVHREHPTAVAYFCRTKIINSESSEVFSFADEVKKYLMPSQSEKIILKGETAVVSLLRGNYIFCPTLTYNMSQMKSRRFPTQWKMVLDFDFVLGLLLEGACLVGIPQVAYQYRRHSSNQTVKLTDSMVRFDEEIALYRIVADRSQALSWVDSQKTAAALRIVRLHLVFLIVKDLLQLKFRSVRTKISYMSRKQLLI